MDRGMRITVATDMPAAAVERLARRGRPVDTLPEMTDLGASAKLQAAFELSPTILAVTSLDEGRLLEVNDAFLRATGYAREDIIGRPIPELGLWMNPEMREQGLAALRQGRAVRDMEARFRTKHGEELVAIASADLIEVDGRPCVLTALIDITARQRAERALRETERRFAQAFHANPLPMSITRLCDGHQIDVNEAALRHSGYTRDEMLGRSKPELGFWVSSAQRDELLRMLHTDGRARDFEVTFRTKSGEHRQLLVNSEVVTYEGEPAVLSVSLDITDRKEAEARQREAERTSRLLAEASRILTSSLDYASTLPALARLAVPDVADWCAVHVLEPGGAIECVALAHVEPAMEALARELLARYPVRTAGKYGVPAVLRTGRPLVQREVPDAVIAAFARTPEDLATVRRLRLGSAMVVPLVARGRALGTLTLLTAGAGRRYERKDLAVAEDLAARAALAVDNARLYAEAEERRREAEIIADLARRSNASLEADKVLPAVADAARALTRCDVARIALWDTGETALIYRYAVGARSDHAGLRLVKGSGLVSAVVATGQAQRTDNIQIDPRVREDVRAYARAEGTFSVMVVPITLHNRVEGAIYCGRRRTEPFTDRDEAVALRIAEHAAIALRNAELFRREQHARAEAEAANRGKDDFLAVLSHELRTPLQAMLGWLRLMRAGRLDEAATTKALATIERNTQTQMKLIGDLLDVSGILAGKLRVEPRVMDLAAVVEAAVQSVRAAALAKHVELTTAAEPGPMLIDGDADRIDQVAANLLSNALKFTPSGGRIDVRLWRDGGQARLTVADSGIGIAPDVLPHVFDRFRQADSSTTRSHGGLGLGLALVRYLVEAHGGSVRAESAGAGAGATFAIALPLRAGPGTTRRTADGAPATELGGARVLVVEDDADTRDFLGFALGRAGVKTVLTASTAEALDRLTAETFDVVVSDLSMPGADGYALIRRLREMDAGASARRPAVALTAHAGPDERRRALEAGFDAYLVKPVDAVDLTGVVARLLRG
jgi:PAS domain S-box-containing protein